MTRQVLGLPRILVVWVCVGMAGLAAGVTCYRVGDGINLSSLPGESAAAPARTLQSRLLESFGCAALAWLVLGVPVAVATGLGRRWLRAAQIQRLFTAVEQAPSALLIVDVDRRIEYVNEGLCLQTGFTRAELVGRPWREFLTEATPPTALKELSANVRSGRHWEGQWVLRRKDGSLYPAHGRVSPVTDDGGRLMGFVAVVVDMTEKHRQETELRAAKDRAEAGDRAKGEFLATMSHEVRTPLNGIVGFTSLLLETDLSPEQREYVQTIRTSGEALIQLTGDILDFSRIESEGLQLEATPCDLRETLEDALDLFAGKAAEKGLQLLHFVDEDVPTQVVIDGVRVRQVLVNLIGNGLKFTPQGEVEVTARVLTGKGVSVAPFEPKALGGDAQLMAELDDGSLTVEFAVRDTGIGIAPADRARLFQPFTQLDSSSVRRFGGAGLGLAISRNLVRLMGGEIWLESELGRGTTFRFTVRCRPLASPIVLEPAESRLVGLHVAVVCSLDALWSEIEKVLRSAGAAKVTRADFRALTSLAPDFVVVDCDTALVDTIGDRQEGDGWPADRVIGLVTVTVTSLERQALRPHFRLLLNKPVHHRTLVDLMAKAAVRKTSPREAASPLALKVLVVEDHETNQRLMQSIIEELGCQVRAVGHGRDCLRDLAAAPCDAVIMDLHLPELDGLSATRQIRAGEAGARARDVWIIATTADMHPELREMAATAGANDFVRKPLTQTALEAALRRAVEAKSSAKPSS